MTTDKRDLERRLDDLESDELTDGVRFDDVVEAMREARDMVERGEDPDVSDERLQKCHEAHRRLCRRMEATEKTR